PEHQRAIDDARIHQLAGIPERVGAGSTRGVEGVLLTGEPEACADLLRQVPHARLCQWDRLGLRLQCLAIAPLFAGDIEGRGAEKKCESPGLPITEISRRKRLVRAEE